MKSSTLVLCAVLMTGCVSTVPHLPTKQDFQLPPEQLVDKFEAVKNFHPDHYHPKGRILLKDLQSRWGSGKSQGIDWKSTGSEFFTVVGLPVFVGLDDPKVVAGTAAGFYLLNPYLIRRRVWELGDYRVTGRFIKPLFNKQPRLRTWEWEHANKGEGNYHDWLERRNDFTAFYSLVVGRGNATISHLGNGGELYARSSMDTLLGVILPIGASGFSVSLSSGFHDGGEVAGSDGARLRYVPVNGLVEYAFAGSDIRIAGGVVYATFAELSGASLRYGGQSGISDGTGAAVQVEYKQNRTFATGLRYEVLTLTHSVAGEIDAGSFGLYLRTYFE